MTVATEQSSITFTGIIDAVGLNVPFPVEATSELTVLYGADLVATLGLHYTVTLAPPNYETAIVTPLSGFAVLSGGTVAVARVIPYLQTFDLPTLARLGSSRLEQIVDRLTFQTQQIRDVLARSVRYRATDPLSSFGPLPLLADRASKFAAYDGGGKPIAVAASAPGSGGPISTFGAAWIAGDDPTGRVVGADPTGVSDSTAAFAAAALRGGAIVVPAGTYICDAVIFMLAGTRITGFGRVRIIAKSTMSAVSHLWTFRADHCSVENIEFEGLSYVAWGDVVYPYNLVKFESSPVSTGVADGQVKRCSFTGGHGGVTIRNATRFSVTENHFYKQYDAAIGSIDGGQQVIIAENTIRNVAGYGAGAIIVGTFAQNTDTDVQIIDNIIMDCGRMDPVESNWQEAIDIYSTSASFIRVAGNIIRRCGNGAVEMKTGSNGIAVLPQSYGKIVIENNIVDVDADDHPGIVCYFNSSYPTPDKAAKVIIRNNSMFYTGAAPSVGAGSNAVVVAAFTDVEIRDNYIDGFNIGINLSVGGSSDATNRRNLFIGNTIRGAGLGISSGNGPLENCRIEGNDIEALAYAINATNTAVTNLQIVNNPRLVATSTTIASVYGIHVLRDTGTVIEGNTLIEGGNEAIYGAGGNVSATIRKNTLVSRKTHGARLDNYTAVEFTENRITRGTIAHRGHSSTGTVSAAMNVTGLAAVIPTDGGAVGDVFRSTAPGAGAVGWVCSVAGTNGVAVWVAF